MQRNDMMELKTWDYLWYALFAFAILGLEVILISFLEPIIFGGTKMENYSSTQTIIHWTLTILCWGVFSYLLVQNSKKMNFLVFNYKKPQYGKILISIILIFICVSMNIFAWGTLKTIAEFRLKGMLLFLFQYLYYFFEVFPVVLIIIFGQKFMEQLLQKESKIPWGGLILSCTWGAAHILSKGSFITGISVMVFSLIYGEIYNLLNRNTKWVYIAIAMAFML